MRIGTIAGFELRIHWSTLVIFGLLVASLAAVQLPDQAPGASRAAHVVAALLAGLAFYVGLLAHEVSHAVLARREGIEVHSLTLWLLGGMAALDGEPRSAGADLRIAGVGPLVSLVIALGFAAAAGAVELADGSELLVATLSWLAGINAILGLFNLLPAAPLDGGRILRAALWAWRGDRVRAAKTAAGAGEVLGYLLIGLGIASLLWPGIGLLWFLLLGWFIINAARAEREQVELQDTLGDLPVSAAMSPDPVTAPASVTVTELLDEYVLRTRHSAFPVVDDVGVPVGLVTLNRIRAVPAERRSEVRAADIACARDDVVTASPHDRLVDVLPQLNSCADGRALVVSGGRLRGLLTATDVARALEVSRLRGRRSGGG